MEEMIVSIHKLNKYVTCDKYVSQIVWQSTALLILMGSQPINMQVYEVHLAETNLFLSILAILK